MTSLENMYNESLDIKQGRLLKLREIGVSVQLEFLSTAGIPPRAQAVDAMVRFTDVTVAPRERDVVNFFSGMMATAWADAYTASVQP